MNVSDVLSAVAEWYFGKPYHVGIAVDEVNYSAEFVEGQMRGHQDAYEILMGTAEFYAEREKENDVG